MRRVFVRALGVVAILIASTKLLITPRASVTNALVVPVEVRIEGFGDRSVRLLPGQRWSEKIVGIPRVSWSAIDPAGDGPLLRGVLRSGTFEYPALPFLLQRLFIVRYRRTIDARVNNEAFGALVMDNQRSDSVSVEVERLDGARWPCVCGVPPHTRGFVIGYFPLTGGLRVKARARSGTLMTTRDITSAYGRGRGILHFSITPDRDDVPRRRR